MSDHITATGVSDWMLQSEVNWDDDLGLFDDAPDILPADFIGSDLTPSLRRYLDAALIANGWLPVVVSSPDSGGQSAGKRPVGDDWQHGPFDVASVAARRKHNPLATNTGILCGATVGADNDLRDPEHAAAVNALVKECLGDTGFQRVGSKGAMLVYANEMPIRKIAVRQAGADKTLFEFLGTGTQFVAYGEHPDGMAYRWLAQEPLTSETWELPRVTPEQIRDCTTRIVDYLIATGAYVGVHATGDIGADRELLKPAGSAGEPVTPEQLREMLAYIKPAAPMGEGEWLGLGLMLRHGQVPVEPAQTGEWFIELLDDWTSGKLWRERTKGEFTNPLYDGLEGTLDRLDGGNRERQPSRTAGNTTIGTVILRAKEAGYGAVKASDLYDKAGIRSKHEDGDPLANETEAPRPKHKLYRPAQWAEAFKPPSMLVEKLLPDDALTAIAGYTGSGKTFVAADLAFCIAAGLLVFGCFKVLRSGPVVYCCAEGPGGLAHRRFAALAKVYTKGVMPKDLIISDEVVMLAEPNVAQNWIDTIKAAGIRPVLFVNDTKGRSMAGADTNHEGPTYLHYNQLAEIRREFQCAVIDVMHYGKNESAGIAGSQANSNAIDWSLIAAKPGDPQVPSLLSVMTLTLGKMKDDPSDADVTYLRATKVPLGKGSGSLILQPISKADYQAAGKAKRGDDHRAEVEAMLDAAGAVTLEQGLTLTEAAEKLAGDPAGRPEMEWNRDVERWKERLKDGSSPPRRQPNKDPAMLGLFALSRRPGSKAQNFWFLDARLAQ